MVLKFSRAGWGGLALLTFLGVAGRSAHAQNTAQTGSSSAAINWQNYDWLKPATDQPAHTFSGSAASATTGAATTDPHAVLSTGALWQDKSGTSYTRKVGDGLSLSCESSTVTWNDGPDASGTPTDLTRAQKAGFQFHPIDALIFSGNVHGASSDGLAPAGSFMSSGAGFAAESHLPYQSVLTLGINSDRSGNDLVFDSSSQSTGYDAQLRQPLGKIPLTAVLKGHYDETSSNGLPGSRMPSLEQSLVWKPAQDTIVQMGLRQQHYENFPGITNEFNEALFADWSQKIVSDVTWHSYAEMVNSRGILDTAPAVPLASGANGTPQAATPSPGLNSALPLTLDEKTLTFSTGPSFRVQKDLSASIEYSNRWDQNPAVGGMGPEQRVSVSLKGTF